MLAGKELLRRTEGNGLASTQGRRGLPKQPHWESFMIHWNFDRAPREFVSVVGINRFTLGKSDPI